MMSDQKSAMRQCPFCKEEVKVDAIRCKHCQATILAEKPNHGGICPFCKEQINPNAIRCMHCKVNLAPSEQYSSVRLVTRRQTTSPNLLTQHRVNNRSIGCTQTTRADPGCNDYEFDDDGVWCFVESSEHYCIYESC
jgi:predicted amidophosphoribosyltransferase